MKIFRIFNSNSRRIRVPSMVLWLHLVTIVAIGQATAVERPGSRWYPQVTDSPYSAARPRLQAGKEQTIRLASATQTRTSPKKWLLAEQREAIFNAGMPQKEGSGQQMGLSLLRATLREYSADIRVEERKCGGTRFVVAPGRYQPQNITSIPTT